VAETHAVSRADLDAYDPHGGRGAGANRYWLCFNCADEHPRNKRRTLSVNVDTGAWHCFRCDAHGLLEENKTPAEDTRLPRRVRRRRSDIRTPAHARVAPTPSPAEQAEAARTREGAARLWRDSLPIDAPDAAPGAAYLAGRGIPLRVALDAGVRYHPRYPDRVDETTHRHGAVVFRVQDAAGKGVAVESRYLEPRPDSAKSKSRGAKGSGVFVAWPGALDVDAVTVCEGPLTALSVAACGFPAVALCGQRAPAWLARRLALRAVVIAFDEGEAKTETKAAELVRELVTVGARPYRLRLPAGVDVNDRLQAVGVDTLRAELDAALCNALMPNA
jgi:DNA primase